MVVLIVFAVVVRPSAQLLPLGAAAPPLTLGDTMGRRVNALQQAAHHSLVIDFFDTQCDTCKGQSAQLCSVSRHYDSDVFVAVDAGGEGAAAVSSYAHGNLLPPCSVTTLLDPTRGVSRAYRAAVVPTVYVVDSSGKIAYAAVGSGGVDGLAATLQHLGG